MVARSPTHVFPFKYTADSDAYGAYDNVPLGVGDRISSSLPTALDGQFSRALFAHFASQEP